MNIEYIKENAPIDATHYEIDGDDVLYYAKDYIERWCYVEDNGDLWPTRQSEYDRLDKELKLL